MTAARTAAQILVDCLIAQGVRHAFCVPGESYLAVLDALYDVKDQLSLTVCRHEAAAANMAEAAGKLSGRPGIAFVTRGPGATHAAIGVHTARQDSTPMILFVGQIARTDRDREAFQELDYRQVFGGLAKWAAEIDTPQRMAEYVGRAFAVAMNGRPGPVVLALPEDMLTQAVEAPAIPPMVFPARTAPDPQAVAELAERLHRAERPLIWLGGSGWTPGGLRALARAVNQHGLPVATAFRRKALFDNCDRHYAGELGLGANPRLLQRVRDADLLIALGTRLSEITTQGYTLLDPTRPQRQLVHVHGCAEELGKVYQPGLAIQASPDLFAECLASIPVEHRPVDWCAEARADYEAWITPVEVVGGVNLARVIGHLSDTLPRDAILTNGAGNFAAWLHRYYQHRQPGTQLAPTSGAMGYGAPAAIAASILHPERMVVCVAGDGDFQMSLAELATAVERRVAPIFLIANNGVYGTIRMHQALHYPGRISGTTLANPDFAALARSYGAHGATVERTEDFAAAFADACASGKPAVLDLKTDARAIAPGKVLSAADV